MIHVSFCLLITLVKDQDLNFLQPLLTPPAPEIARGVKLP